ncbi:MAG: hypothetical protein LBN39_07025, partial [Planctomycetaceae bacterium]|nr:hypothetical protein [Planctomycetaceae bacterium]
MIFSLFSLSEISAAEPVCPIFPIPKEYKPTGEIWKLVSDAKIAIVIGNNASEQERYAADRLRLHLKNRFDRHIAIVSEKEADEKFEQIILMGQPANNDWVKRICATEKIELTPNSPGMNGFILRFLKDGKRQILFVGGSDALGTIYGGDALFDLMSRSKDDDSILVSAASVRDFPSIPWRGRPHSVLKHHLVPGAMDAYIRGRINFSDIRDDPKVPENFFYPARKASMGLPAGQPLDVPLISEAIKEFHRRGIFVYGTVSCAVPKTKYPDMLKTFDELLKLGTDGIWISLDDTGAGENPKELVQTVLDFGKQHGIAGRNIAYTPPLEEYQHIDRPLNHEMAKIPGFDEIMWFFTRVPCQADLEMTQKMGLKHKPGWWFNLADGGIQGGLLHSGAIMVSLRKNKPGYLDIVPMTHGWGAPQYDKIQDADRYSDQVLLWAVCDGNPEEYEVVMFGNWAWNPKDYSWDAQRRAVYRYLYGDNAVETAFEFDNLLAEVENQFLLPRIHYTPNRNYPPRLKDVKNRQSVLAQAEKLKVLAEKTGQVAAKESAIDRQRLETVYLEPMRAAAKYAAVFASLDYPEYQYGGLADAVFRLQQEGKTEDAKKLVSEASPKITEMLKRIEFELTEFKAVDEYAAYWKNIIQWESLEKRFAEQIRQKEKQWNKLAKAPAAELMPYKPDASEKDLEQLFETLPSPPKTGKLLKEIEPAEWLKSQTVQGQFLTGLFERCGIVCAGAGLPGHTATNVGDYAQLRLSVPVPKHNGRIIADLFVADTRIDNVYPNVRTLSLFVNGHSVWEQDITTDQRGKEWVTVDLTDAAAGAAVFDFVFTVNE